MKVFAFLALFALASAQEVERQTVTAQLLQAQSELTIGHEFAELFLTQNRQRLSDYLERIERIALDGFLGAYAQIKNKGIETRQAMAEFTEPSFCKDNVRARWELQVTRYGQKLSQCLGVTDGLVDHDLNFGTFALTIKFPQISQAIHQYPQPSSQRIAWLQQRHPQLERQHLGFD
jgi:hypothetical protein